MLWYIAIIGAVNLGLGYFWGVYIRPRPRCANARAMGLSLLLPSSVTEFEARTRPGLTPSAAVPPPDEPVTPTAPAATDAALDATTGLMTREQADEMLDKLMADESNKSPLTVALVEMAPAGGADQAENKGVDIRVLRGVSDIVRQSLAPEHALARFSEQQFLVLVPQENVQQTTRRAEELRQRVATTEFVADGQQYQTTVTCALAAVADLRGSSKIYEILQEALDEAKRYGGNRTFMHDGKSPTPVVPIELTVAPQQLAV